jgi:outer membrane protein OmpA-like peptidoglycan-associated protein
MTERPTPTLLTTAALTGATLLWFAPLLHADDLQPTNGQPMPAQAGDFALKVEPGLAIPLTHPQSQRFKVGGGETIKALWTLNEFLDVGPSVTFLALPTETAVRNLGTAWTFGGGLRVKRPHHAPDDDSLNGLSPWADTDLLYVRTGGLDRPGFAIAAGLAAPIGKARVFWVGPFVRYLHILQGQRTGFDNHDAKILSLGLSLEVGSGVRRAPAALPAPEIRTVYKETLSCPDRDHDQVADTMDHCPDVAGAPENWGCPAYQKLVVKRDKLELKERLYFAWNQAVLQEVSFPVLDEVVQALNDNKGFRVQVEGHTSAEGGNDHNQTLSERRAESVLDYLVAHGIAKDRLVSKGFASSVPADTNATSAGRENNRRVEFVVNFTILNDGSK